MLKPNRQQWVFAGFAVAMGFFVFIGLSAYLASNRAGESAMWVQHTLQVKQKLDEILGSLLDAETGERGFIITGDEQFLASYERALTNLPVHLEATRKLIADNPAQQTRFDLLERLAIGKLAELRQTVELRRSRGRDAADQVVLSGRGKNIMNGAREAIVAMDREEARLLEQREAKAQTAQQHAVLLFALGSAIAMLAMGLIAALSLGRLSAPPTAAPPTLRPVNVSRVKALSDTAALLVFLIAVSVLTGWIVHLPRVTNWFGFTPLKPNTALGLALAAAALGLLNREKKRASTAVGRVIAALVLALGALTLVEYLLQSDLGVDNWLIAVSPPNAANPFPSRMSPITAFCFLCVGLGLLLLDSGKKAAFCPSEIAAVAVLLSSVLALVGYAYGVSALYRIGPYSSVALHTAVTLTFLGVGILAARPERGLVSLLTRDSMGSILGRRLLLSALVIPLVLGWLSVRGEEMGFFDLPFGTALLVTSLIMVFVALIWWTAASVDNTDIERRKIEEAAKRYEAIVESSDDAIISKDLNGVIRTWNAGAQRLFGYTAQEAIGQPITMLIPPQLFDEEPRVLARVRRGERIEHYETVRRHKDGLLIDISLTVSPIADARGVIFGASKIARDVTERRRAEMNLALLASVSQDLVRFENVNDIMRNVGAKIGAYLKLSVCNFIEINEGLGQADCSHDWHREDVPSTVGIYSVSDFLTDDFQKACRAAQIFVVRDTITDPRAYAEKFQALKIRSFIAVPLLRDGQCRFLFNVLGSEPRDWRDDEIELTRELASRIWTRLERAHAEESLRESEERFRALAENIPQLAWMTNSDGGVFWYNQRWYDYTGTTLEQMQGWGWQVLHDPDHVTRVTAKFKRALETGEPWKDTFPLRGKDGNYRWFLSRAFPIRDGEGKITRWFGTNTDVTELRDAEDALRKAQAQLEERAGELEETVTERTAKLRETLGELEAFSYSIAHDMRAPLRAMQGFANMIEDECGSQMNADGREYLRRIAKSANRLDSLIQDVLNYSKIVRAELDLEPVDLPQFIQGIIESYPNLNSGHAGIRVEAPLSPVLANPAALTQVVSNLLGNAVKFVKPGVKPQVRIRAEPVQDGMIRVWFEDNGIGIRKDVHERIFQMFQRLNPAGQYDGTGIGLAIVRKAVERMGGHVGVESELGKGSRFWIQLRGTNGT